MSKIDSPSSISVSQNFLKDPHLAARLVQDSSVSTCDTVLEIGPGRGILTVQLARRCGRVIAIERDPRLSAQLAEKFTGQPHVYIHSGDFLDYHLPRTPYKVFANIPFFITSAIMSRLTTNPSPPQDAYLFMQKEAAEMFLGWPRESLRSVLLKPWFEVGIKYEFRRRDFSPAPRVDVVLLRLRRREPPLIDPRDGQTFRDFVVYAYTGWQPALSLTLKRLLSSQQLKRVSKDLRLDLDVRPSFVPFESWLRLFETLKMIMDQPARRLVTGSERHLSRQQRKLQKEHRTRKSE